MTLFTLNELLPHSFEIPGKYKANCYAFALAPPIGRGGYTNRPSKSVPGNKRLKYRKCFD